MRVVVELVHIALGLIAAAALAAAAAWAYPQGARVIWWCGAAAMVAAVLMGIEPLRAARAGDRDEERA